MLKGVAFQRSRPHVQPFRTMSDVLQVSQSWLPSSLFSRESGEDQTSTHQFLTPSLQDPRHFSVSLRDCVS